MTITTLLPALVTSVSPAAASAPGVPLDELRAVTTEVATGLVRPIAMVGVGDWSGRLLIAEKGGTVRVYDPETGLAADPVLDLSDR